MNKPIIIDGVDVAECEYCIIAGAEFPECRIRLANFEIKCEGYNCYFKQLQRLKAENEALKSTLDFEVQRREVFEEKNAKLMLPLEEIHNLLSQSMDIKLKSADKHFSLIDEAIEKVKEVLKDEN